MLETAMVFEALPDRPRPRLPRATDGIRFLSLDDAAARYNLPRQALLNEWLQTFSSIDLSRLVATPLKPVRVAIPGVLYRALSTALPKRVGQTTRSFILAWLRLATRETLGSDADGGMFAISDDTVRSAMEKDEELTVRRLRRRVRKLRAALRAQQQPEARSAKAGRASFEPEYLLSFSAIDLRKSLFPVAAFRSAQMPVGTARIIIRKELYAERGA